MSRLKVLSGQDVVDILLKLGFHMKSQRGSHMKLECMTKQGAVVLVVPNHGELRTGTLHAIYKKIIAHLEESSVRPHFYTE